MTLGAVPFRGCRALLSAVVACVAWLIAPLPVLGAPLSFAERHPELKVPDTTNESAMETEARKARARQEFMVGTTALDAKKWADCEAHLAVAWMLQHSPAGAGNLGLCEVELGYFVDALEHLAFAEDNYDPKGKDPAAIEAFRRRLTTARDRALAGVGRLRIDGAPAGATVRVGAKLTFTTPHETVALYPGEYVVEVRKDGRALYAATAPITAGGLFTIALDPPRPPAPPAARPSAPPGPSLPVMIGGGALALTFAGVGTGLIGASDAKSDEAQKLRDQAGVLFGSQVGACHAPTGTLVGLCKKLDATTDDAAILERVGLASLIAGGAFAVGTTAYGLWPRAERPQDKQGRVAPSAVGASAVAGPSGGMVMVQGVW